MNRLAVWIGSVVVVLAVLGLGGVLGWSNEGYVHIDFMVPQSAADFIRIGHDVTLFDEGASYTASIRKPIVRLAIGW